MQPRQTANADGSPPARSALGSAGKAALGVLSWLFVSPGVGQRRVPSWQAAVIATIVVVTGMVWTDVSLAPSGVAMDATSHPLVSLELRFNAYTCNKHPYLSDHGRAVRKLFADRKDVQDIPASDIVAMTVGSEEAYCASLTEPFLNNENSLGLLYHAFLVLNPNLTINDIAVYLRSIALLMLGTAVFTMLTLGLSPALALLGLVVALHLEAPQWEYQPYSVYPLLLPTATFYASALILTVRLIQARRWSLFLLALFVTGSIAGFYLNLRTSHAPLIAVSAMLAALSTWTATSNIHPDGSKPHRPAATTLLGAVVFLLGLTMVHRLAVDPGSAPVETAQMHSHHVIAHPLVLSLALPPNPLSEREGIRWLDRVGLDLARRIDPDATYLGPTYERALWTYYRSLWKQDPEGMADVYLLKWRTAGKEILDYFNRSPFAAFLAAKPATVMQGGVGMTLMWLAFAAYAFWRRRSLSPAVFLALSLISSFGLLLLVESSIIHSTWNLYYQAPTVFALVMSLLVCYQFFLNAGANAMSPKTIDSGAVSQETIRDFGTQWTTYDDTSGYFGSVELLADFISPFPVQRFKDARVADIGAGTGRFSRALLTVGASQVIAVEPSEAVNLIRTRVAPEFPGRVEVLNVPGDDLPANADLDYAISVGVLHHIPEPAPVVSAAYAALKPSGQFIVWLYGKEGNAAYLRLMRLVRPIGTRLPPKLTAGLAWLLDLPLIGYMGMCRMLPRAGLPLTDYLNNVLSKLPGDKRRLVIYDQIKPRYARYYTEREAADLMSAAPFDVEIHSRRGYSWVVIGTKPAESKE